MTPQIYRGIGFEGDEQVSSRGRRRNGWIRGFIRRNRTAIVGLAVLVGFLMLAIFFFVAAPALLVAADEVPVAKERLALRNDVRTTGVQLLGGAVLALGALLTARTIRLNREGQITERFTRAIDQLGARE